MTITLWCNDPLKKGCHWIGERDELVYGEEDDECTGKCDHCPNCDGTDFDEDENEDEEDQI